MEGVIRGKRLASMGGFIFIRSGERKTQVLGEALLADAVILGEREEFLRSAGIAGCGEFFRDDHEVFCGVIGGDELENLS